jgi:general secretion pathway protein J
MSRPAVFTLHRVPGCDRRGFTLIEVLVALLIMAILASLAWQGLDAMVRARSGTDAVMTRTLRLNTVMTQWEQDLAAVQEVRAAPAISFDGQSLRLVRRADTGVVLVVWAVRGGVWQRWASQPVAKVADLREQWLRSQQLLGNEPGQTTLVEATGWQVYFFRGGAWTNAQSTGDLAAPRELLPPPTTAPPPPTTPPATPPGTAASGVAGAASGAAAAPPAGAASAPVLEGPREQLPAAVRMVITLGTGTLTRDVALGGGG